MAPKKRGGGGGKLSRRAALALVGGGGLLAVSGTGAFNTVEGDRGFDVTTADDQRNAALGIIEPKDRISAILPYVPGDGNNTSLSCNPNSVDDVGKSDYKPLLTLKNNESQPLTDISVTDNENILDASVPDAILPGETGQIKARIIKDRTQAVTVEITARTSPESGNEFEVTTTQEVAVEAYYMGGCDSSATTAIDQNNPLDIPKQLDSNSKRIIINGSVKSRGSGKSKIKFDGNGKHLYINGDVRIPNGSLEIKGENITIAGKVVVDEKLDIHATGSSSYIKICGTANPDVVQLSGNNATVCIDGEKQEGKNTGGPSGGGSSGRGSSGRG